MSKQIKLSGTAYPFDRTPEGEKLLKQLNVDVKAVKFGNQEELQRFAYCMAAGAARAAKKPFEFTVEKFIKACPHDWKKQALELLNEPEKADTTVPKK